MTWQSFALALAPYVVTLAGLVLAFLGGKQALAAKDAQLAAKDEQLETLKLMAPERVVENVRALHAYYAQEVDLTKAKLAEVSGQLDVAGTDRKQLQAEVRRLHERLGILQFGTASTATVVAGGAALNSFLIAELVRAAKWSDSLRVSSESDPDGMRRDFAEWIDPDKRPKEPPPDEPQ